MDDMHEAYSQELRATPVLTALQERSLAQAIEAGRDARTRIKDGETGRDLHAAVEAAAAAREKFIRSNLRLVVSIARHYHLPPGIELQDLVQEGSIGLEHAVDKFDWRKGFKFSTYGSFWIRQSIGRSLDYKSNLVHIPVDRSAEMRRAIRECGDTAVDLDDENARLLQLSRPLYLDSRFSPHSEQSVMDLLADDSADPEEQAVASIQTRDVAKHSALTQRHGTLRRGTLLRALLPAASHHARDSPTDRHVRRRDSQDSGTDHGQDQTASGHRGATVSSVAAAGGGERRPKQRFAALSPTSPQRCLNPRTPTECRNGPRSPNADAKVPPHEKPRRVRDGDAARSRM